MIRYFIKEYCRSKSFFLAVIMLYAFLLASAGEDLDGQIGILLLFQLTIELGVAILLRPIAAALPISFFLMREWGSHYYQSILIRTSSSKYAASKVITAYIVGFLVPLLACILLFLTVLIYNPAQIMDTSLPTSRNLFPTLLSKDQHMLALFLYICAFSLAGAIWSAVIVGVSLITTNAYVLVAAPFLLERVFSYILQFLSLKIPFVLCFDTSQSYALCVDYGLEIQFLYSLIIAGIVYIMMLISVKRRQKHG